MGCFGDGDAGAMFWGGGGGGRERIQAVQRVRDTEQLLLITANGKLLLWRHLFTFV